MSGREDRNPPKDGDGGRESDRGDGGEKWSDRPVLPSTTTERGTISNSRNPKVVELLPGGRLVVNFRDDPGWDH